MTGWAKKDSLLCQCCVRLDSLLAQEVDDIGFKSYSAAHGTKNIIANRLVAVSERSSLAGAFKRVLIHDILRWKVGGSNPSVPMWLDSYQLAGNWQMPCKDKNSCRCCLMVEP